MSQKWITSGPQFWVTKYIQKQTTPPTTSQMWRDIVNSGANDIIPSKAFLKHDVMKTLFALGNVKRVYSPHQPYKRPVRNGWELVQENAFKYIHPDLRDLPPSQQGQEIEIKS